MVILKCWTVNVWKQTIWGAWKITNLVGAALGLVCCDGKGWYERIHGQLNCYWELSWKQKCCCYCIYLDKSCHIFLTWLSIYYWWWHYTCRKNTYKRINAICNIIQGIKHALSVYFQEEWLVFPFDRSSYWQWQIIVFKIAGFSKILEVGRQFRKVGG